jgi:hypothetical protein
MESIRFQYYESDIKSTKPLGDVGLKYWINSMVKPKEKFESVFLAIEEASKNQNKAEKDKLKRQLYYFTPCVKIKNQRKYINIVSFTGLMTIDFDGLEADYAIEFKNALFNEYKFIICAWLSASKKGVRALIKIPIANDVKEFKEYFNAIEQELGIYKGFDKAPQNCVLPMFMSYDKDILYREDYCTWVKKYTPYIKPIIQQYFINGDSTTIEKIIYSAVNKITSNGHPQLRAVSYALGGYVSAEYISEQDAMYLINKCIDSNAYLSRRTNGMNMSEVYKATAKTMVLKGQNEKLFINGKI